MYNTINLPDIKEIIFKSIKDEVRKKSSKHKEEISYLRNLIKPHDTVDYEDLDNIIVNGYMPRAQMFSNFKVENFNPLKKEALVLFHIHMDSSLMDIGDIMSVLIKNNFGIFSINYIPEIADEYLIIIS
ncbi:hypothetical protein [Sulfurimonas sp. CS5]|uniref:hypothetical protein n=1 Tax=Sulfurimonas sp. CS5 TaxID=3391145 RepID=UPI0039E831D5